MMVGIGAIYQTGYFVAEYKYQDFANAINRTLEELDLVQKAYPINASLAIMKREINIAEDTIKELRNLIQESLLQIENLREQVYFYQSVVAPEDLPDGLSIFKVSVSKPLRDKSYLVDLVLRWIRKDNKTISGQVDMMVYGKNHNDEAVKHKGKSLQFSFQYFQRIKGNLDLPENFFPEKLSISVNAGKTAFEKTYLWKDIATTNRLFPSGS